MEFQDSFEIPAAPDDVMRRFMDVESVARCVPGLTMEGRDEEGNYLGVMTVAFGPKRLKFQGRVKCEFDPAGRQGILTGGGTAARSASMQVRTTFSVRPAAGAAPAAPRSLVQIESQADLQGVLAQFAGTGGVALGRQLMREFALNLTQALAPMPAADEAGKVDAAPAPDEAGAAPPAPVRSLSAFGLLWAVLIGKLKGWFSGAGR